MKLDFLNEPRLIFANGNHICPRRGITAYGVFDQTQESRRSEIHIGGIGTAEGIETLGRWLERCKEGIAAPADARQQNLRLDFCGFNKSHGFHAEMHFGSDLGRSIKNSDIGRVVNITSRTERIDAALELYYEEIKFLAQNRHVDVIVCVLPENLYDAISSEENPGQDTLEDDLPSEELNFRRALKAKAMPLGKPLQLVRQVSLDGTKVREQQDDATKAWNFCTALYYKSGPTIPWKLENEQSRGTSCAIGIAFYRSRDRATLRTSLAQIFDELGNGLILRGTPVQLDKDDRIPRLSAEQAHNLFSAALKEYRIAMRNFPARVVVHKSSNFTPEEIAGIEDAAQELRIDAVDFVTIMDSRFRLFRDGQYPPFRGTLARVESDRHLLYSRGSVWYYQTYPGLYVPQPIELRIVKSEESPRLIANEILGLTKMNWNNTQFDGKYPVTLGCARKVGEVMKYLSETDTPQVRYGYYM
ncbi:hypothetical protein [uncultured Roseibium sp.]|uniref:argonaute/piwi family protein n=1 Tax=uncultured Roseibium sp. TaxID=1936171 RepID=UPI0026087EFB|nr:hypothetical protein [uncultured Roseibium sp.]